MHGASLHRRHRFRGVMIALWTHPTVRPAKAASRQGLPHAQRLCREQYHLLYRRWKSSMATALSRPRIVVPALAGSGSGRALSALQYVRWVPIHASGSPSPKAAAHFVFLQHAYGQTTSGLENHRQQSSTTVNLHQTVLTPKNETTDSAIPRRQQWNPAQSGLP